MTMIASRINTLLLLLLVLMAGAIITMLATRAYGGPLDPTGPPTSTDGVRGAGTPISSLPFAITVPGYYYVTRPLTGLAGQAGITISTSNVTLDLGGFTLGGGSTPGDGISVGALRNINIRNGAVRGWSNGIAALACGNCRVDHVQASSNTVDGIDIGPGSEITDCNASLNGLYGIYVDHAAVRRCTATENTIVGIDVKSNSVVDGNRLNGNPSYGIYGNGDNNTIRNNDATGNGLVDISVFGGTGNVVMGNTYCLLGDGGTNTILTGNVDRVGGSC